MPNRHSEINNCPRCGHRLWLRKVKERRFYNCLHCGYEAELEQPKYTEGSQSWLKEHTRQEVLFDIDTL